MSEETKVSQPEADQGKNSNSKDSDGEKLDTNKAVLDKLAGLEAKIDSNSKLSSEDKAILDSLLNEPPENTASKEKQREIDYDALSNKELVAIMADSFKTELANIKKSQINDLADMRTYLARLATKNEIDDVKRSKRGDLFTKLQSDIASEVKRYPGLSVEDALVLAAARKDPTLLIPKKEESLPLQQKQSLIGPGGVIEGVDENADYKTAMKTIIGKMREANA